MSDSKEPEVLMMRYLEGELSPEEVVRLNEIILTDSAAREELAGLLIREHHLRAIATEQKLQQMEAPRRFRVSLPAAAALLMGVCAMAVTWYALRKGSPPVETPVPAVAKQAMPVAEGEGFFLDKDGRVPLQKGQKVHPGQGLETEAGTVTLTYPDGTAVTLGPSTKVWEASETAMRILHEQGVLIARVSPQPPGRPMVVVLPSSEVQVAAGAVKTVTRRSLEFVHVNEGRVQVTRTSNQESAEVAGGQFSNVVPGNSLAPKKANPAAGFDLQVRDLGMPK